MKRGKLIVVKKVEIDMADISCGQELAKVVRGEEDEEVLKKIGS